MKQRLLIVLALSLTLGNFGCATMRRHPVVTGAVIGLVAGGTFAIVTTHNCKKVYDGKPYDGTPPCPK